MDKLQQAKEVLLTRIIQGDMDYDARFDAEAYNVLCQAELSAKVVTQQIDSGFFKPHCHHDEFPTYED